jgi:hypothetical protein
MCRGLQRQELPTLRLMSGDPAVNPRTLEGRGEPILSEVNAGRQSLDGVYVPSQWLWSK